MEQLVQIVCVMNNTIAEMKSFMYSVWRVVNEITV